ncbi:MAG: hypothetical protein NC299_09090 [Lachnospiraceae bacterium]|nr:hypothetical protein [Lachnospiraceae bacterium]
MFDTNTRICELAKAFGESCDKICKESNSCKECPVQEAIDKLAAYEDSGLSPEEVKQLAAKSRGGDSDE